MHQATSSAAPRALCWQPAALPARHPVWHPRVLRLADRAAFGTLVSSQAAKCRRSGESMVVLHLTLETDGDAGYAVARLRPLIADCAERLASCVRRTDHLVHHGGLSFGVVLSGADQTAALMVGERLRGACSGPYLLAGRLQSVRLQIEPKLHVHGPAKAALSTSARRL